MARILTTLRHRSNRQTPVFSVAGRPILFGPAVWFILPAAMTLRASRLLLAIAAFSVWGLLATSDVVAQKLPKGTGKETENRSDTARRERRKRHQATPPASKTPDSAESKNFLDLGDRFAEQKKWKAAEAAYKEAVKVSPGNVDALLELGFLYIDKNRMDEAQQTYSKLRSLNASYASELLAEINRLKNSLAH
jgi:tetratricopeptide (TPR) repeat protein